MDPPWTYPFASRSPVHKARQAICDTGFCRLVATCAVDCCLINDRVSLVDQTLHAGHEPAADDDWSLRHHALAICVYRAGNQAIVFCSGLWLSGPGEWEDSHVGRACAVFNDGSSRDNVEIH